MSTSRFLSQTLSALLFLAHIASVESVLQSLLLDVTLSDNEDQAVTTTMRAAQAFYGTLPDMDRAKNPTLVLTTSSEDNNFYLCDDTSSSESLPKNSIIMVPRGLCTFEKKSLHAQRLGAKAVLVYGALEGRYSLNTTAHVNDTNYEYTTDDIVFPADKEDYDCDFGKALLPADRFSFDPLPYNKDQNNPLLKGDDSLCMQKSKDGLENCPSKACLLTGKKEQGKLEACCAWDLPIWLYFDPAVEENVNIPSAYITMEQASELKGYLKQNSKVEVVLYSRWRPSFNVSSILIWALGVAVAALAAYLTAGDYRELTRKTIRSQQRRGQEANGSQASQPPRRQEATRPPDDVLELTAAHALVFIVMASTTLLVLFYFKIYGIVKIFYALVSYWCEIGVLDEVKFSPAL